MKRILLSFIAISILISCNSNNTSLNKEEGLYMSEPPLMDSQQGDKLKESFSRKIIREGTVKFETHDVNGTNKFISDIAKELKGYISKDEIQDYSDKVEHNLVIRIPVGQFDLLLSKISSHAGNLESKSINSRDVTEEYVDVEARLNTKSVLEKRHKELLNQAKNVTEILSIEKELGKLREDIESVEGRLRYLKDNISMSTLTVIYYQKKTTNFGFGSKFGMAIQDGWNTFLLFLIGVTHLWIFIVLAIIGYFVVKRIRRARK